MANRKPLDILQELNWKAFSLAGVTCYFLLSFVFRGSARHAVSGRIFPGKIALLDKIANIDILHDTGHTLSDPFTHKPVITVWQEALWQLWTTEQKEIIRDLASIGAESCLEKLSMISPGMFCLLPYRAVGIKSGMLLCFSADAVEIDGVNLGSMTVAISSTPVSDGGGYTALWGGQY